MLFLTIFQIWPSEIDSFSGRKCIKHPLFKLIHSICSISHFKMAKSCSGSKHVFAVAKADSIQRRLSSLHYKTTVQFYPTFHNEFNILCGLCNFNAFHLYFFVLFTAQCVWFQFQIGQLVRVDISQCLITLISIYPHYFRIQGKLLPHTCNEKIDGCLTFTTNCPEKKLI